MQEFDTAYETFLAGTDPKEHRRAIKTMLSKIDLDGDFLSLVEEDDGVESFFLMWEQAAELEEDENERSSLREFGRKSKQLYHARRYADLCNLYAQIAFVHLCGFLQVHERADFEDLTDHDLFKKGLLPSEIFLQYFLLETLGKTKRFVWDRDEEIVRQNLACMIICYADINAFINEDGEGEGE